MSFKEHLFRLMITYPMLYPNAIQAYNYLFLTIGNGYNWIDGEMCIDNETLLCRTKEEAIVNLIKNAVNNSILRISRCLFSLSTDDRLCLDGFSGEIAMSYNQNIHTIMFIDDIMQNFCIPKSFKFNNLTEHSMLANIPDDIRPDWLKAISDFIYILDTNKDLLQDEYNLLSRVKDRVSILGSKDWHTRVNESYYLLQ